MWLVLNEGLCSLAHYFIWEPGATIEGKVDEMVDNSAWMIFRPIYGGVYCFDSYARLIAEEGVAIKNTQFPFPALFDGEDIHRTTHMVYGLAIGTVKLWGEVIEHEKGYRAQYAKLQSIDGVFGDVDLLALRERYKV